MDIYICIYIVLTGLVGQPHPPQQAVVDGALDDAGKAPEKRVSFVGNPAADDVVPPAEDPMKRLPTLRFEGHSVLTV